MGESHASIEHIPMPILDDYIQHESEIYNADNVEDLIDKIVEEGEIKIIML